MKFFFDFFPVLLFFAAYKLYDIYVATIVAIVTAAAVLTLHWLKHRQFSNMHLTTMALLVVFGGLTLYLKDPIFIKWKPTVINWLFAAVFLGSQFVGRATLVERMMSASVTMPAAIWTRLNLSWVAFFAAMGVANLFVVYNFDESTWVNFKLFGMMGLTFAFVLLQAVVIARHVKPNESGE